MIVNEKNMRRKDEDQTDVVFHDVSIVIAGAKSAEDAYDVLCKALASAEQTEGVDIEWTTATYTRGTGAERSTDELFPKEGSTRERKGRS